MKQQQEERTVTEFPAGKNKTGALTQQKVTGAEADYKPREPFMRNFGVWRELYFFLLLSPVALATVTTAPLTASEVFRPTLLTVATTPDELRLLEARFFEPERLLALEDLDCFLDDCLEPPEAVPRAFLVLLAAILSPISFGLVLRPPERPWGGMKISPPHPTGASFQAAGL